MNSAKDSQKQNSRTMARNSKELKRADAEKTVLPVKVKKAAPLTREFPGADEVIARAKLEREKRLIMWTGVAFLMSAIVIFWVFNTRSIIFRTTEPSSAADGDLKDLWSESRDGLTESIRQLQEGMAVLEEAAQAAERQAAEALDDAGAAGTSESLELDSGEEAVTE